MHDLGGAAVKLRVAYGKGIRPPETTIRATSWMGMRGSAGATKLSSEEQSGVEAGMDLLLGRAVGLHVTRFDQVVSGLIQPVAVSGELRSWARPGEPGAGGRRRAGWWWRRSLTMGGRIAYELQNVGEITNRGWEISGSVGARGLVRFDRVCRSSTVAFVGSRTGYSGDLRPGDRMLEVPERTLSVDGVVCARTVVRVGDGIARVRLGELRSARARRSRAKAATDLRETSSARSCGASGATYPGVNRLRANLSYDLRRALSLVVTADNLLDHQLGEPDNVTVLPGRTVTGGLRAKF